MNDTDLDAVLDLIHTDLRRSPAPSSLHERVRTIPVTTPQQRGWLPRFDTRGFTMFSAVKFVAAAAIVALFGGFLLAGGLTTPQEGEVLPAAVSASPTAEAGLEEATQPPDSEPSPMTTEELLSGMVTEEVEPGVLRVVNDGVRDLSFPLGGWGYSGSLVDVTPDGSVWLSVREGRHGLFRLGEEPVFEDLAGIPSIREVAPDGSFWGLGELPDDRWGIFSFDGEGWTVRATTDDFDAFEALAVGPDGTVWVVEVDGDKFCPDIVDDNCWGTVLLRLEDDGSRTTIEDWADFYDGDAHLRPLAVSPDGDVWLVGTPRSSPRGAELLLRFDGEGWEAIPGPEGWTPGTAGQELDFGPDGALWVKANAWGGLARFDDPGWTTFTEADGVQPWEAQGWPATDPLNVAADGSLWLLYNNPTEEDCGGVAHYHGTTWTSYLAESCIHDLAIAPDGSVWLGANDFMGSRLHIYVITPEAVAATE